MACFVSVTCREPFRYVRRERPGAAALTTLSGPPTMTRMAVRADCRHYSSRSVGPGDIVQRCRVDAAEQAPFACPENCLFFEPRPITDTGWNRPDQQ